jgi:peptidoglycan/xylan/chitin deacetylase (PgdA/CDA1 family)
VKTPCILFSLIILFSIYLVSCKTLNITSTNDKLGIVPSNVMLTFDDGPNQYNNTTERLLDVLNKYKVKAAFCLIGVNVKNNPEIVRRIFNEGHTIVNHGYSDKIAYFLNDDEFRENILLGEKAIREALGFEIYPKLYRPNGGIIIMHDIRDAYDLNESKLEKKPNGAYNRSWIPEAVEEIIIALLDKEFIFSDAKEINRGYKFW